MGAVHEHVRVARAAYDAFAAGDLAALAELIAEDVRWHVPGTGPLAGEREGRPAVYGLFAALAARTGGTLRQRLHAVLADDDHAVALVEETATRDGEEHAVRVVHVLHVRDGRIHEFWEAPVDLAAYEALFGDPSA